MLILTRRVGKTICISVPAGAESTEIEIRVVEIKHSQVRIGVHAPRDVAVDREEIAVRKANEVKQA
jgi:carbon storage regulator